jgi:hypothetical protein
MKDAITYDIQENQLVRLFHGRPETAWDINELTKGNKVKVEVIYIEGYWKDNHHRCSNLCVIMSAGGSDSLRDRALREIGDDDIFYVFEEGEQIVGEHLDFVVTSYSPVKDVIVYERNTLTKENANA